MRALIQAWIGCVGVACTGVAMASPKVAAHATPNVVAEEKYQRAVQLTDNGEPERHRGGEVPGGREAHRPG